MNMEEMVSELNVRSLASQSIGGAEISRSSSATTPLWLQREYPNPHSSTIETSSAVMIPQELNRLQTDFFSLPSSNPTLGSTALVRREPLLSESWPEIFTHIGQEFPGGAIAFRHALNRYSIKHGYNYVFSKNDRDRVTCVCKSSKCGWKIHAVAPLKSRSMFVLKAYNPVHTCEDFITGIRKPRLSTEAVSLLIAEDIRENPTKSTKDIVRSFKKDYGIKLSYYYSYHARNAAISIAFGEEADSYAKLSWYVDALSRSNPNSHIDLEVDEESHRFIRIFIALGACIEGYKHCRPLIFVDGTFAKTKYNGCILAAVAKNGNDGFFVLAYAVVDVENDQNWLWFFRNLKECIDCGDSLTFMSDRHNGILNAVGSIFPLAKHSYCVWHLRNNLNLRVRNGARKSDYFQSLMFKAARALTQSDFSKYTGELCAMGGPGVEAFLNSVHPEHWADAFFPGKRYGLICSSLSESFNSWIRDERVLPISIMLDMLRMKIMNMMNERRIESSTWASFLCPKVDKEMQLRYHVACSWTCVQSGEAQYEVLSMPSHSVDLSQRTCSCRKWQVEGIPCEHAILCIKMNGGDASSFFDANVTTEAYCKTYGQSVNPVPTFDEPKSYDPDTMILPPLTRKRPGRPRSTRIESAGNFPKRQRVCGRCNQLDNHNRASCNEPI